MRRFILGVLALGLLSSSCTLPGRVQGSREVTAVFDDVGDLVSGHSVQVADVRVGSVVRIELTEDFTAKVTMSLADGVDVPRASIAVLRTTSLLGEKFIELRPTGDDPAAGPYLEDGDRIAKVIESPELEFVAEEAVQLLGGVAAGDVQTLVQTGAVGFGGRGDELRTIIDDLSVISGTLADQTENIGRIIDGFAQLTGSIAEGADSFDQLLVNLDDTVQVLTDNRQEAVEAIEQLTRLAQVQNEAVFEPYLDKVDLQIKQLDAVLTRLGRGKAQVDALLKWLAQFTIKVPKAIPNDFAQVYTWAVPASTEEQGG